VTSFTRADLEAMLAHAGFETIEAFQPSPKQALFVLAPKRA